MLHIIHLIQRRYPGNARMLLVALALASAGLLAAGIMLVVR